MCRPANVEKRDRGPALDDPKIFFQYLWRRTNDFRTSRRNLARTSLRRLDRDSMGRRVTVARVLRRYHRKLDSSRRRKHESLSNSDSTSGAPAPLRFVICEHESLSNSGETGAHRERQLGPGVNLDNENPTLLALGKAHPYEPESERSRWWGGITT